MTFRGDLALIQQFPQKDNGNIAVLRFEYYSNCMNKHQVVHEMLLDIQLTQRGSGRRRSSLLHIISAPAASAARSPAGTRSWTSSAPSRRTSARGSRPAKCLSTPSHNILHGKHDRRRTTGSKCLCVDAVVRGRQHAVVRLPAAPQHSAGPDPVAGR